jgi:hypothetical protein
MEAIGRMRGMERGKDEGAGRRREVEKGRGEREKTQRLQVGKRGGIHTHTSLLTC